ncbi:MAG: PD-(D/E)XK nuclease family protein [Microcystaceae cyanobacterium]
MYCYRKHDSTLGALGSRWGLFSEKSFRNALAGILEESFGVEVLNINDYDPDGIVFGRPDQVEIDVIIKNGLVIVCEIKSSMSKSDIYTFSRKVEFYQQKYQRNVNRKLVISPMVDATALPVAENLGVEVYSYAEDVSVK